MTTDHILEPSRLAPLVGRLLADEKVELYDCAAQPLEGGFSGSLLYRVQGQANTRAGVKPWSLILKVIQPTTGSQEPWQHDYWKRELLVYQSDLLADLPGDLTAPRCLGITEQVAEEFWLWLEDLGEDDETMWPLEHYAQVACHLGEWNGRYLVQRSLPQQTWLSSTAYIQQRLALAEPGIAELPRLSQSPHFADLFPGDSLDRILRLWEDRQPLLARLEQLPHTLCHRDTFRRNLRLRQGAGGHPQTVLLDWAKTGIGLLGEELVPLLALTLRFFMVDLARIAELDALIFAGYVEGLRAAGWKGDARLARFGFTALTALLMGVCEPAIKLPRVAQRIAALPAGAEPPPMLGPGPVQYIAFQHHLLAMGDEAHTLLAALR
ncbi:MAG: phosphotransferase [Caldilineaceae bacterium]